MKQFFVLCVFTISFAAAFDAADLLQHDSSRKSIKPVDCPELTRLRQPFDLKKYLGAWYEIKSTKPIFENGLRCVKTIYGMDNFQIVFVNNSAVDLANNALFSLGVASHLENALSVHTFFSNGLSDSPYSQYWVVDTDYDNYALVVSCNAVAPLFTIRDAWILSRKPTLDDDIVKNLVAKLPSFGYEDVELLDTAQNC
ncbi:apolipoprotein D-like [Tetranychus urticae]|uniref:Lipocalin/cytosolic fatty-acid binding domain-containing protein n=1 Tax=Tetranychus urticae TaxID=32264 RepID=T1KDZ1_TETUR|nr:apolipoprotein D-like [Tetranychus urticae]